MAQAMFAISSRTKRTSSTGVLSRLLPSTGGRKKKSAPEPLALRPESGERVNIRHGLPPAGDAAALAAGMEMRSPNVFVTIRE